MTDRHAVVCERLVVDRDTIRRADGILPTVALTDRVLLFVTAAEVEAQFVEDLARFFGKSVLLDERAKWPISRERALPGGGAQRAFRHFRVSPRGKRGT